MNIPGVTALVTVLAAAGPLPPPVPGYPIGWCIRANADTFAEAKRAGFEYVELALQDVLGLPDSELDALVRQLQAADLDAFSGYNPIPADMRVIGPGVSPRVDEHLEQVVRRAKALNLDFIVLNSGASWRLPDGTDREKAFAELVEFARRFADVARKAKIGLLAIPLRGTDSNMITTIDETVRFVEAVNRPNFAMMADYSFLRIQKEDPVWLARARKHLRHVWIANPEGGRTYPMNAAESDYASFFKMLKQIGYRGRLSVHARTSDFAADAQRAITFLRTEAQGLAAR